MPLDERAIRQVIEQVERRLRQAEHGRVEVNVNGKQWSVKHLQPVQDENE